MQEKKNCKCLMIKTKDKRKFFTDLENYDQLIEFSKLFKPEISIVEVKQAEVLDLQELAPAFCNNTYKPKKPEYKLIKIKFPTNKREVADEIRKKITKLFKENNVVSLKELHSMFSELSISCVCNHLIHVRKTLQTQGYKIKKVGVGKYQLDN